MEQLEAREATERIGQMEQYFDTLQKAADNDPVAVLRDPALRELLQKITRYYEGGQWQADYELDEKGLLPQNLKRGVLAQDAVYDLLAYMNGFRK